jgi:hypothetical protein
LNARIDALIEKVKTARWLDTGGAAGEDLDARVAEHVAAFGRALVKADATLKAPGLRVTRCAEELCSTFLSKWGAAATRKDVWGFQEALRRANAARWMESDDDVRSSQEALEAALTDSLARSFSLCFGAPVKDPPFMRVARNELAWLARDDDEPSPWGPLLDLWAMGAWPVWLPDGVVMVYVPECRDGEVAWVPESPTPWDLPAVAGEMMTTFRAEWADWKFRQKDALLTVPRYRVAAAAEDLLVVFDAEWIHPYVYPLRKREILLGRIAGNDIVLAKGNVSKRHAAIMRSDGRWFVGDIGSSGGTFLNGRKVTDPTLLEPGDRITFSGMTLRVLQPGEVAVVAGPLVDESAG